MNTLQIHRQVNNVHKIRLNHNQDLTIPEAKPTITVGTDKIFTYIVFNPKSGLTKIGRSGNPFNRIRSLQTKFKSKFNIIKIIEGDIEKKLHLKYAEFVSDLGREWFFLSENEHKLITND